MNTSSRANKRDCFTAGSGRRRKLITMVETDEGGMKVGGVVGDREGCLVCVHRSVSGVCRGGQGNKSEQRGVMRFGLSAAVINTTLGSTSGHAGSGQVNRATQPKSHTFL